MKNVFNIIKDWTLIGICCLFFSSTSCVTQKVCLKKFPPDTVKVQIMSYRDTIININVLPVDTIYEYGTLIDTLIASSGTAHGISYVVHDTLKLFVWQSDTIYKVKLDSAIKVIDTQQTVIHTLREKFVPKWVRNLAGVGGLVVGVLLLLFIYKVLKFFKVL